MLRCRSGWDSDDYDEHRLTRLLLIALGAWFALVGTAVFSGTDTEDQIGMLLFTIAVVIPVAMMFKRINKLQGCRDPTPDRIDEISILCSSEEWLKLLPPSRRSALGMQTCAICLSDIKPYEVVRGLVPCGHSFHPKCIDPWFRQDGRREPFACPLCRTPIAFDAETGTRLTLEGAAEMLRDATALRESSAASMPLASAPVEPPADLVPAAEPDAGAEPTAVEPAAVEPAASEPSDPEGTFATPFDRLGGSVRAPSEPSDPEWAAAATDWAEPSPETGPSPACRTPTPAAELAAPAEAPLVAPQEGAGVGLDDDACPWPES